MPRAAPVSLLLALAGCGLLPSGPPVPAAHPPAPTNDNAAASALLDRDGALEPSDTRSGQSFVDRIDVPVAAGERVRVTLTSTVFDPVLEVTPPRGAPVSNDDHLGDRTRSQIELAADVAGALKLQVSSFTPDASGAYHVRVERIPPALAGIAAAVNSNANSQIVVQTGTPTVAAAPAAQVPAPVPVVAPTPTSAPPSRPHHLLDSATLPESRATVRLGANARGDLAAGDWHLTSGEPADVHVLTLARPTDLTVRMTSSALDSYLFVVLPDGSVRENDDSSGGLDSQVVIPQAPAGRYRLVASAYRATDAGAYELSASGATGRAAATRGGENRDIEGALAAGDTQISSGEYADAHQLSWPVGTHVRLEARSTEFDTYLIVRPPTGEQRDNDDQAAGQTDAAVEFVTESAAPHTVTVTSYRPGELGRYTLRVSGGANVTTTPDGPTAPPAARVPIAPTGGGHAWLVSVGISDYPGSGNDLPECANDAVKIAEAMRNQGLTAADHSILLTDAQATVANVRTALQRVASQIQSGDTFVLFYSGHGGQTQGQSTDRGELDGVDEYLVLHDGHLVDDEVGRLIDGIHARTTLTALDACFAGGFAKDVITRPGIVGLFSSEEDVTSSVAGQFQAGGYLSHFLRLGIQGEADADPRNGTVTVGELTHYVWQQYGQHASGIRTSMGYQHLVVDRGGVHADQVLWGAGG